jgi:4-amino-4-deoxy-L-arabinose transferase-like glycosyltransferase
MSAHDATGIIAESGGGAQAVSATRSGVLGRAVGVLAKPAVLVTLFTLIGLVLRFYRLDARGLWFDEVTFAYPVRMSTPGEVLALNYLFGDQSPLSFFLTWLVRGLGGSERVVRLPFAIAGTLCIPAIYFLGRELAGVRVGLVAALLFALSPFAVFYSQDAHPYSPLLLFTTMQVFFAYRAGVRGGWFDWAGLALFSILNLYNDYIGLIVSAVVGLFLLIALASKALAAARGRGKQDAPAARQVGMQVLLAVATFAVIAAAYWPWVPMAQKFLNAPGSGFDRLPKGVHGTFSDMLVLSHGLGLDGLIAVLLSAGVLYMVITLVRERRLLSVLLFIWLALPLAAFWLRAGDAMLLLKVPYFSFLFPAAIVLVALGIDRAAWIVARLWSTIIVRQRAERSQGRRWAFAVAFTVILLLALVQTSVAVAASYSAPKAVGQDYRGAVDRVIAESTPGSLVLSLGMWGIKPAPDYIVDGMNYYLWLRRSPIKIVDGSLLDEYRATHIADKDATIWGAYQLPWPIPSEQLRRADEMGLEVIPLENLSLLRERAPRGDSAEQIDRLLAWGSGMEPGLVAVRSMLNPQVKTQALGDNLLPSLGEVQVPVHRERLLNGEQQVDKWVLWAGSSPGTDGRSFELRPDGGPEMVNVTLSTLKLTADRNYVLAFRYRNVDLSGEQRVYMSLLDDGGRTIDTYPYGAGFLCPANSESGSAFAFHVPAGATNAIVWLRATGKGSAEFSDVELRPVK